MRLDDKGYSLTEVVAVLMIGDALMDVSIRPMGSVIARLSVNAAQESFVALHARARARAVA